MCISPTVTDRIVTVGQAGVTYFMGRTAFTGSKNVYLPFHHPLKRFSTPFAPPFADGQINFVSSGRFKNYIKVSR